MFGSELCYLFGLRLQAFYLGFYLFEVVEARIGKGCEPVLQIVVVVAFAHLKRTAEFGKALYDAEILFGLVEREKAVVVHSFVECFFVVG